MDYFYISSLIRFFLMCFLVIYEFRKLSKKNKQLEADYEELLKQVELLVHENNMLKKHDADMV